MTQMESKPASSAARQTRASVSPMAASPPGQVNDEICNPTFTVGNPTRPEPERDRRLLGARDRLLEKVYFSGHHHLADDGRLRPGAVVELDAANQHDGLAG